MLILIVLLSLRYCFGLFISSVFFILSFVFAIRLLSSSLTG